MKITVLTLFPKMISGFFEESIIKRAVEKKLVEIELVNLRDFAIDEYGTVDDRPYGGGAGMVLRVDVIHKALSKITNDKLQMTNKIKNSKLKIVLTSPRGKVFDQGKAQEYSKLEHLIIIAGHYEGVDERVNEFIDEEVSIGDYVLTGGEIPVAVIVDSVVRLISGVLKKEEAVRNETFDIDGKKLLEYPHYTRPENFEGLKVPDVLLSGNHKEIEEWRLNKAEEITKKNRPDLLDRKK
ncbi:tRNA (guanosine(37)-N1)-methyltransferase TrmD [Candidatus Roizmanbacteria bacterium]|nr:tRNA (guanosine(37)-N1)-methyltransferase TrmD [Candidatus Roizmanbacteria bacterium]